MNILSLISKSKGVQGFNREYKIIAEDNGGVYKGVLNSMKEAWTSNPLFVVFHGKQKIIYNKSEIKALSLLDKAELFDKIMGIKEGDNVLLFTKTDRIEKINYNIIKLEVESYFKLKEDSILIKTRKLVLKQAQGKSDILMLHYTMLQRKSIRSLVNMGLVLRGIPSRMALFS